MHPLSVYLRMVSRWRWRLLLGLFLGGILIEPIFGPSALVTFSSVALFALILLGAVYAAEIRRGPAMGVVALIAVWVVLNLADMTGFALERPLTVVSGAMTLASLAVMFFYLVRLRRIDLDALVGAVFGYFLLAQAWASLFHYIERWRPGAFSFAAGEDLASQSLYFSLVTVSTLGYGDIVPVDALARICAALEAAVGTLYIAIMVGTIVGGFHRRGGGGDHLI